MQEETKVELKPINMTAIYTEGATEHRFSLTVTHPPRIGDKMLLFFDDVNHKYFVVKDILFISSPSEYYIPKYIYVEATKELSS